MLDLEVLNEEEKPLRLQISKRHSLGELRADSVHACNEDTEVTISFTHIGNVVHLNATT